MDEGGRPQGLGRLLLKALAIASALTFLAIMMVNACATYATPTKAAPVVSPAPAPAPARAAEPPPEKPDLFPATKSAAVVPPPPLVAPATKSGAVFRPRPLMQLPPEEPPQQAAPQQRGAR